MIFSYSNRPLIPLPGTSFASRLAAFALTVVLATASGLTLAQSSPVQASGKSPVAAAATTTSLPPPAAPGPAASPTILVIGDSLSAGYGLAAGQGWVDLLQKKLANLGFAYRVVNASISGDTTAGGRTRIAAALEANRPQIVIIELGANDGLRGGALPPVRDNLDQMVALAKRAGAQVLLLGMQLPPNYGAPYIRKFSAVFSDVAKAHSTAYVPFLMEGFGDRPELFQADRIHPTAQAQPLMVENVWPELVKLLPRRP
jgi:acyl-CoA thioesterase-1